jgi:hypothetical protein
LHFFFEQLLTKNAFFRKLEEAKGKLQEKEDEDMVESYHVKEGILENAVAVVNRLVSVDFFTKETSS